MKMTSVNSQNNRVQQAQNPGPYTPHWNENRLKVFGEIHLGPQLFQTVFLSSVSTDI